jgi:hypothetical protein
VTLLTANIKQGDNQLVETNLRREPEMASKREGTRVDVEIWTAGQRIMGRVFVPNGERLSDCLNDDGRRFLSVTDVEIKPLEANSTLWQGTYLAVNKSALNVVRLLGDNDIDEPSFAVAGMQ